MHSLGAPVDNVDSLWLHKSIRRGPAAQLGVAATGIAHRIAGLPLEQARLWRRPAGLDGDAEYALRALGLAGVTGAQCSLLGEKYTMIDLWECY